MNNTNKNLLFLLMLTIFSFTTSCNDDDIIEEINETFIIGKWQLSSVTENGADINLNDCELLRTFEFNASNEVIITIYDFNTNDTCEMNSSTTKDYSIINNSLRIESIGDSEISTPRSETLILKSGTANNIVKTYTRQ